MKFNNWNISVFHANMQIMKKFQNIFLVIFISLMFSLKAFSATAWINDLRALFLSNNAIIYAINIRTFNAKDINNDGIIDEKAGESRGNFLNAIDRLDELASYGVNTVNLLPVTSTGKIKALGTAGSLYSISSFNTINPQLKNSGSNLSAYDQMREFVDECHKRNIRVIVDLPCCGAYDLYLKKPELFVKDANKTPVIPADWTDVRLLDAGNDLQINKDVYNLYSDFINLMTNLGVDGIKANIPNIKPYSFWKQLIDDTRLRNPQFLFLAEASPIWEKSPSEHTEFISCKKLLDAGFDGYYGNYMNLKNWKTSKSLISNVKTDIEFNKKYAGEKSVLGNFATHDQISPILVNGPQFNKMIIWLSATLPLNSYYIDGFNTGDNYIYFWANKKASETFTDDEYYFVHRGQLDIFNFSKKPGGNHYDILQDFIIANKFKNMAKDVLGNGNFVSLKTSCPSVFAYSRNNNNKSVIVIGNLDFKNTQKAIIRVPKINDNLISVPIKISNIPTILNRKISTTLSPGEVQVLYFSSFNTK